jgi:TetR/AcrR family transcriptional regulator, fatty acid metabolism regulator protein
MKNRNNAVGSLAEKEPQAPDKYQRILEAGIKVFARKGFHNARVSEIAAEAGVADGTIYIYFKNKDELLIKVFEESLAGIIARFERELSQEPDPLGRLKRFIRLHLEQMEQNQALAEVIQVELRQSNKFMKEYVPARFYDYLDIIARIVSEGQQAGLIRPEVSPGIFKRALFGALDEISLQWVLRNKGRDYLKTAGEQLCGIFLKGVINEGVKL